MSCKLQVKEFLIHRLKLITLNFLLMFYRFTCILPTTNSPSSIRKIKPRLVLSKTGADTRGSVSTVLPLDASTQWRRFHLQDLTVDRQ